MYTKNPKNNQLSSASQQSNNVSEENLEEEAALLINYEEIQRAHICKKDWEERKVVVARVALIVTAINLVHSPNTLLNRVSKWVGATDYGMVHTAVQIGPIMFEWNDSSLIIPTVSTNWSNDRVLCALELAKIPLDAWYNTYLTKISKKIAHWNSHYDYNAIITNCQTFTKELLKELNLENALCGRIPAFLNSLCELDPIKLSFHHQMENGEEKIFNTHTELDQFVHSLGRKLIEGSDDWKILKAYNRVFWLRHYAVSIKEYTNQTEKNQLLVKYTCPQNCCPFGDPSNPTSLHPQTFVDIESSKPLDAWQ